MDREDPFKDIYILERHKVTRGSVSNRGINQFSGLL